jgi:hypothetical protein
LTWSKDDSNGAFGKDKVQINLRRGDTYTLTATATNSEGTITRTLELEWGCGGEVAADGNEAGDDQEDGQELRTISVPLVENNNETATLYNTPGSWGINEQGLFIGEWAGPDNTSMGFISFNISSLSGVKIEDAIFSMDCTEIEGDPSGFSKFHIGTLSWGERMPGIEEFNSPINVKVGEYPSSGDGNIVCQNDVLRQEIQKAVDQGKSRFQLKVYFSGSNINGQSDIRKYSKSRIILDVAYSR